MGRAELTNPQHRIPDLLLPSVPGGQLQPIRPPGRRAPVLVLVHGANCSACCAYVDLLASEHATLQEWDGSVRVVVPEPTAAAPKLHLQPPSSFAVLADPEQRLARAAHVAPPAVVIADQWGEIHYAVLVGPGHAWPTPAQVAEWLRFLAIRCPECEGEAF